MNNIIMRPKRFRTRNLTIKDWEIIKNTVKIEEQARNKIMIEIKNNRCYCGNRKRKI